MGLVLLIGTSKVLTVASPAATGTKPEWMPAADGSEAWIGWQGASNVDWVTV